MVNIFIFNVSSQPIKDVKSPITTDNKIVAEEKTSSIIPGYPDTSTKPKLEQRISTFINKPNWLTIFQVFVIPVVFILISSFAKKLARRVGGFERKDFFLGIELVLAATSGALASITEGSADSVLLAVFLVICFFSLLQVVSLHQDKENTDWKNEMFWLTGLCNIIGTLLMIGYLIFLKV